LIAVERAFLFQNPRLNPADGHHVAEKSVGSLLGQETIQRLFAAASRRLDS
jgi:hypothetical protein